MANDEYNVKLKRFTNNKWETLYPLSKIKNIENLATEEGDLITQSSLVATDYEIKYDSTSKSIRFIFK